MVRVAGFLSISGAVFSNLCLAIYPRKGTETQMPTITGGGYVITTWLNRTETQMPTITGTIYSIAIYTP